MVHSLKISLRFFPTGLYIQGRKNKQVFLAELTFYYNDKYVLVSFFFDGKKNIQKIQNLS